MPVTTGDSGEPRDIADGWSLSAPDDVGLDGAMLAELDAFLKPWPKRNIHAVVVARRGKLIFERYFAGPDVRWDFSTGFTHFSPTEKHDIRSISKSVTSLLVGIALGEGAFPPLESPMIDSFPEYADLRTAAKARITFGHLLTMSPGLAWTEAVSWKSSKNSERQLFEAEDPCRYALKQRVASPPGTVFNYSGGATTLLASALARATGSRIDDYARDKLFAPLGIADFEWLGFAVSTEPAAFGGLRLRPRDLAKLGQLVASGGLWRGTRVLPEGWMAESTRPRLNTEAQLYYGYHWWLGRSLLRGRDLGWIAGLGSGGQRLFVVPELDLVVAINAAHFNSRLQSLITTAILNRFVLPAVKE